MHQSPFPSRHRRRLTGLAAAMLALSTAAHGQVAAMKPFVIPAGALAPALAAFSEQAGVRLDIAEADVTGMVSPGVDAATDPEHALAQLLRGTGLRAYRLGDDTYRITLVHAVEGGEPQLGTVQVLGRRSRPPEVSALTGASLKDTPKSVSVYDRDVIDNVVQARSIEDVTKLDGAVRPTSPYGLFGQQFNIRGMNVSAYSYTRDGLTVRWTLEPFDQVERVEILKGVSGLEYGANVSPGGSINLVPKMPLATAATMVETRVDGFGGTYAHLDTSQRFGTDNRWGLRVNLARDALRYANDITRGKRELASFALDYRTRPGTVVSLNGYTYYAGNDRPSGGYLSVLEEDGTQRLPKVRYSDFNGQRWGYERFHSAVIEPKLVSEFGNGWTLTANAHVYWLWNRSHGADPNADARGEFTTATYSSTWQTDRIADARVQLDKTFTAGRVSHHVSVRLDHSGNDQRGNSYREDVAVSGNICRSSEVPGRPALFPAKVPWYKYINNGVALNDHITLGEHWLVNLGARYSHLYQAAIEGPVEYRAHNVSPAGSIIYKPTERLSVYAGFAQAIEPAGAAPDTVNFGEGDKPVRNARQAMAPVLARQSEVGLKWRMGDTALVSLAFFRLSEPNLYVNRAYTYVRGGDAKYQGAELSLTGDLTPKLKLVGGVSHITTRIVDPSNPDAGTYHAVDSAKWAGSLYGYYTLGHGVALNGGVSAVGARALFVDRSLKTPGYATVDLGASWTHPLPRGQIRLQLGIDNVANTFYWASASYGAPAMGQPRTVKLTARYDF